MRSEFVLITNFKKYPALFTVIPFSAGILLAYLLNIKPMQVAYLPVIVFIGILIVITYTYLFKFKFSLAVFSVLLITLGFLSFQNSYYSGLDNNTGSITSEYKDVKIILKGTVAENPEIKSESIRILLEDVNIDSLKPEGMVLASIYKNKFKKEEIKEVKYGDVVEIEGKLEKLPGRRNPGEFNYGEYLKLHDVDAVFYTYGFDKINITGHSETGFYKSKILNPVKNYSIDVINRYVGGDEGEYLKGLVLGERSSLSKEIKEDFVNAGVAHIIAVSGLNVAYVILIIWAVLTFIPVKQVYKITITILLLVFYMNLTGNSPSIIRATIMASVFLAARLFERKTSPFNIAAFAALIILLLDPRQLFDAGFILSFSAILSIMILYPKIDEWLRKIKWYASLNTDKFFGKAVKTIMGLFFGTLAAQLGTLPITAIMFKKISIVSLAVNIFMIPLSNLTLAAGFVIIITSLFSSWLASVFASFNVILMFIQLKAVSFSAGLDYAFVETYFIDGFFLVIYFIILTILYYANSSNVLKRILIAALIAGNFAVFRTVFNKTDKVQITYIDAGNSNSTLVKMPLGTNILINSGGSTEKYTSAERNIIPYLKTEGVNQIDILLVNSLNQNEFRSLLYLVNNFDVKKIVMPVYYKSLFENKIFADNPAGQVIEYITEPKIINKQGTFRLYVYYNKELKGESMMTELLYGEQSFIFNDSYNLPDDYANTAYLPEENSLMVLKLSGAGSFDYNSPVFIAKAEPEFIVISSPGRGRKKASYELFTQSLNESGYTVLKTSEQGAIIFETDGLTTQRINWK